jgi:hypothetical protein
MHRAMSLPLWWRRNHHTPWSIHAWEIWGYGLREDPNNQDESSWANHDHRLRMRMTWAWWDGDLVLLASTSPFTFTINLYFLSLVLPCSCFLEREGEVRNGRLSQVGSCISWWFTLYFRAYDMWDHEQVEDNSFSIHCCCSVTWRIVR